MALCIDSIKGEKLKMCYNAMKCILLENCKLSILPLHQVVWSPLRVYWYFFLSKIK